MHSIYPIKPVIHLPRYNTPITILDPLSSKPVFIIPNETFSIHFSSPSFDNVYVQLDTANEPITDTILLDVINIDGEKHQWTALVQVPIDTTVELYNLTVFVELNGLLIGTTQPRAVNIIETFDDTFNFVHITDFHVGDPRGFAESITETIGYKSIKRCINEINLLHPDFVVISGDLVYGQLFPIEYRWEYKRCFDILQLFDVPTFLVPGNHDGYRRFREDGLDIWKHYFGPHYYSFDYGTYHFMGLNSFDWPRVLRWSISLVALNWGGAISEEQLEWIDDDLDDYDGEHICMFLHHNPLWDTKEDSLLRLGYKNREALLDIIDEHDVDIVLAGHVHYDNVTIEKDTIYLTTTTPESNIRQEDGYWGYRRITVDNGTITSYNYKEPKYSIPSYHLNLSYVNPYTAVVENDLEQTLPVTIEFVVPKGLYQPNRGTITSQRSNAYLTQITVETEAPFESEITVTLTLL